MRVVILAYNLQIALMAANHFLKGQKTSLNSSEVFALINLATRD